MIGIIGGTGLEKTDLIKNPRIESVSTPFGNPSSDILIGQMHGKEVALLSRHGREHTFSPSGVNYRANIQALKQLGCDSIIATTACGSLREEIKPGDFALAEQFIDFTRKRQSTFFDSFEPNKMQHCSMANPYSEILKSKISETAKKLNFKLHADATIITIEGPRFSSKAESKMFRLWGADLINMSTATETILANELALDYAVIAVATDYDCWRESEETVSIEMVIENFKKSLDKLILLISELVKVI